MSESRTFVLKCEDGYKVTLSVALAGERVAISSQPKIIDDKHAAEYEAWLGDSVVPGLLAWLPDDVKLAFAALGAQIMGTNLTNLLDNLPQDEEDDGDE